MNVVHGASLWDHLKAMFSGLGNLLYKEPSKEDGHHFKKFGFVNDEQKLRFLNAVVRIYSKHGRVREETVAVLQKRGVQPRDYPGQIRALLEELQSFYYVWEKKETFQSPMYTLTHKFMDCDDGAICLAAMLESIDIPAELELLGKMGQDGKPDWSHIYCRAGLPPRNPTSWPALETTRPLPAGKEPASWLAEQKAAKSEPRQVDEDDNIPEPPEDEDPIDEEGEL